MFSVHPLNGQTWLICGGRKFSDQAMFDGAMSDLLNIKGCPSKIVHGGATGADGMAHAFAHRLAINVARVPADWQRHGKAAGPIRNQQMLDEHRPNFIVAFPGGKGTVDMIAKARAANIDVCEVKPT